MSSCQPLVANFRSQDRKQLRYCVLWDADNCAFTASNMEAIQAALHPARLTSTDVFASGCTARHLLEPAVGEARPAGVSIATQAPRTSLHRQLPSLLLVCATWLRVLRVRNTMLLQQLFTRSSVAITDTSFFHFNFQLSASQRSTLAEKAPQKHMRTHCIRPLHAAIGSKCSCARRWRAACRRQQHAEPYGSHRPSTHPLCHQRSRFAVRPSKAGFFFTSLCPMTRAVSR
jgi:hypothetical protein